MARVWAMAVAAAALVALAGAARAEAVGERHLTAVQPSAALRDAEHRKELRITVWYRPLMLNARIAANRSVRTMSAVPAATTKTVK